MNRFGETFIHHDVGLQQNFSLMKKQYILFFVL